MCHSGSCSSHGQTEQSRDTVVSTLFCHCPCWGGRSGWITNSSNSKALAFVVFSYLILREACKGDELRSRGFPLPCSCQQALHSLSWCLGLIHGCSTWVFQGCYCHQVFLPRSVKNLCIHKVLFPTHQDQGISRLQYPSGSIFIWWNSQYH